MGRREWTRVLASVAATACLGALVAAVPATAGASGHTAARRAPAPSQATVNARYLSEYASGLRVPTGWTGSLGHCTVGANSVAATAATQRAINFVRSLTRLSPITLSPTLNTQALAAAMMMDANDALSHEPSPSWSCFTSVGQRAAGQSNLAWRYPSISPVGAISMYLADRGSTNKAVPHRRWILYPPTYAMGSGTTTQANALVVMGHTAGGRADPAWVPWPAAGWFPNPLAPARWSLSGRGVSFGHATVRVYRGAKRLHVHRQRIVNGYGRPTLVWSMPAGFSRTGTYKVVVRGVRHGHRTVHHSYRVRLFTPHR